MSPAQDLEGTREQYAPGPDSGSTNPQLARKTVGGPVGPPISSVSESGLSGKLGDPILRPRGHRTICHEVSLEGVEINGATEAIGSILEDGEVVASLGHEAVNRYPVTRRKVDGDTVEDDVRHL